MKQVHLMISSLVLLLIFTLTFAFTHSEKQAPDRFSQTAPQGMVLVSSDSMLPYYISVTEESNMNWQVYVRWKKEIFQSYPEVWKEALPQDTMTGFWQYYNDPLLDNYFEHPSYQWYPVVGVSWNQVQDYMYWKTDRLNEIILHKIHMYPIKLKNQVDEQNFNTEAYLANQYDPSDRKKDKGQLRDLRTRKGRRDVKAGDGILFPQHRLPTEQEWELAYTYLQHPDHLSEVESSLNKEYLLLFWQQAFHLDLDYPGQSSDKGNPDLSNFPGGASEWLLDNPSYQAKALENDYEKLRKNGWAAFGQGVYDQYGEIDQKDSLGRLRFNFVQVAGLNQALYIGYPSYPYKQVEAYYPNPYYKKDSVFMDSTLKKIYNYWNRPYYQSNNRQPLWYNTDFGSFLRYMHIDPKELTKDSLLMRYDYIPVESPLRKIKTGHFKQPGHGTEWLGPKYASSFLGFRTVLPFTGTPTVKGKKIKW